MFASDMEELNPLMIIVGSVMLAITVALYFAWAYQKEKNRKQEYEIGQAQSERDVIKGQYESLLESIKDQTPY